MKLFDICEKLFLKLYDCTAKNNIKVIKPKSLKNINFFIVKS